MKVQPAPAAALARGSAARGSLKLERDTGTLDSGLWRLLCVCGALVPRTESDHHKIKYCTGS